MAATAAHAAGKAGYLGNILKLILVPVLEALARCSPGIGPSGEARKPGQKAGIPTAQPLSIRNARVNYIEAMADGADEAASSAA